jgi:UPF0148 protein
MDEQIKRMADQLRSGATMLSETCPQCSSPLFKLPSGEIYCINCGKRVVIVKSEEEAVKATAPSILVILEGTLLSKIQEAEAQIKIEKNPEKLRTLVELVSGYLNALEKIKKIK